MPDSLPSALTLIVDGLDRVEMKLDQGLVRVEERLASKADKSDLIRVDVLIKSVADRVTVVEDDIRVERVRAEVRHELNERSWFGRRHRWGTVGQAIMIFSSLVLAAAGLAQVLH